MDITIKHKLTRILRDLDLAIEHLDRANLGLAKQKLLKIIYNVRLDLQEIEDNERVDKNNE